MFFCVFFLFIYNIHKKNIYEHMKTFCCDVFTESDTCRQLMFPPTSKLLSEQFKNRRKQKKREEKTRKQTTSSKQRSQAVKDGPGVFSSQCKDIFLLFLCFVELLFSFGVAGCLFSFWLFFFLCFFVFFVRVFRRAWSQWFRFRRSVVLKRFDTLFFVTAGGTCRTSKARAGASFQQQTRGHCTTIHRVKRLRARHLAMRIVEGQSRDIKTARVLHFLLWKLQC